MKSARVPGNEKHVEPLARQLKGIGLANAIGGPCDHRPLAILPQILRIGWLSRVWPGLGWRPLLLGWWRRKARICLARSGRMKSRSYR